MYRENEELPVKLSRLVINKFRHFRHVELNFDKYTSINGKTQSAEGKGQQKQNRL